MLNRVILIGRLTRDPELRHTHSGYPVASFTVAVDRGYGKDKEVDFIPIIAWNKTGEAVANNLGKGSLVAIDGKIQVRSYEAKEGGRRYITEVVADSVKFLDKRGQSDQVQQEEFTEYPNDGLEEVPF